MSEKSIKRKAIKLALLGDTQVGKTCLCNTFFNIEYSDNVLSTIGKEKYESMIKLKNGQEMKVIFWDTAGQERFRSIALKTLKTAQGVVVVFDVTSRKTFENVVHWLKEINENFNKVCIVLFGNKIDMPPEKREVSKEEAEKFAKDNKLKYFETSALQNIGIQEGFKEIINDAYEKFEGSSGVNLKDNDEKEKGGGFCGGGKKKKKKSK